MGRVRRTTAGNRMRELLEQERERMTLEGEEGGSTSQATRVPKPAGGGEEEGNAIFLEEDNDIDFEEVRGGANEEDIVDSDFDLSSDQGDDDEEEGERALEEEERQAKKASRARAQAIPAARPRPLAGQASKGRENVPKMPTKRLSFAGTPRSSKRQSTMQVSQTIQERLDLQEKRRAQLNEAAKPKRKKIRLSQADLIAEALETEERNRESLKAFLQREHDRKERDRRRGLVKMDGPFLRWRSFTVDRNAVNRKVVEVESHLEVTGGNADNEFVDPVFAARKAAVEERERLEAKKEQEARVSPRENLYESGTVIDAQPISTIHVLEEPISQQRHENHEVKVSQDPAVHGDSTMEVPALPVADVEGKGIPEEKETFHVELNPGHEVRPDNKTQPDHEKNREGNQDREARADVSLHGLPASSPWTTIFSHLLGSHVDWSRYTYVPARNRPLRPRQSVCPVTGWPARYRDPRTGIAYANQEAYDILTQLIRGEYRWSCDRGRDNTSKADKKRYAPLSMGCYMDKFDEPGACNVLLKAAQSMPASGSRDATHGNVKRASEGRLAKPGYGMRPAIAPGDEKAVIAAAQALPAGTTRSGGRRSLAS